MKRHLRDNYYVIDEGILTYDDKNEPVCHRPSTTAGLRKFRFSRLGEKGVPLAPELLAAIATAMTNDNGPDSPTDIPGGFTYLGQFIDHDLTMDKTSLALGSGVTVDDLLQGRSPALDLDSLYGLGPISAADARSYIDGVRLRTGRTAATPFPDAGTNVDRDGFDLPRVGVGATKSERRQASIPDHRNDENLVVAQLHLAFIHFHNRVIERLVEKGTPSFLLFSTAREMVVKHYQWMIRTDYLPRIVDVDIVDDVFTNGRRFFEAEPEPGDMPTMPIEFSVAAFRIGHSMIRDSYQWNRVFRVDAQGGIAATLPLLFNFSGTSGTLSPDSVPDNPESGSFDRLPTNWIADFRRLFDFGDVGRDDLRVDPAEFNITKRIDSLLVDPLKKLPLGSFGATAAPPNEIERNLAFRNLVRANMVELASGQQMAAQFLLPPLTPDQILNGAGAADLDALDANEKALLIEHTPLWLYVLREAEFNNGKLTGVGGRIVAEVIHRAIEGSCYSIVRDPTWRPSLGHDGGNERFLVTDLLLFAFDGQEALLNPLG